MVAGVPSSTLACTHPPTDDRSKFGTCRSKFDDLVDLLVAFIRTGNVGTCIDQTNAVITLAGN